MMCGCSPKCIAQIEQLTDDLQKSVAENAAIRKEVAKVMVALDKGEPSDKAPPVGKPVRLGAKAPENGSVVLCVACNDGSGRLALWNGAWGCERIRRRD